MVKQLTPTSVRPYPWRSTPPLAARHAWMSDAGHGAPPLTK